MTNLVTSSISLEYMINDCAGKIKKGNEESKSQLTLVQKGILSGEIPTGDTINPLFDKCIEVIEKKWEMRLEVAKSLGTLGANNKLTAAQVDRVVQITIKSLDEGWDSKHELTRSVTKIGKAGLLTQMQKVDFLKCRIANGNKESKIKALALVEQGVLSGEIPAGDTINPLFDKCIEVIEGKGEMRLEFAKSLGTLGANNKLTAAQVDRVVQITIKSLGEGWDSKHELTRSVTKIGKAGLLTQMQKVDFLKCRIANGSRESKIQALALAEKGILSGEISSGNSINPLFDKCIEVIEKKWEMRLEVAKSLGTLGANNKLTAAQVDRVVRVTIIALDNGWDSKHDLTRSVTKIGKAGLLTQMQKINFLKYCGTSVVEKWDSKKACNEALKALIV